MNIAIVSPWAISETAVGGTERFTIDLATQLVELGNEVEVFVLSGRSGRVQGVRYTSLDLLGGGKAATEYDLQAFADKIKGNSFYHSWAGYLEASINISKFNVVQLNSLLFIDAWADMPRIFTIHTNPFEYRFDWGHEALDFGAQRVRKALPSKTLLVAPSEYYSKRFSRLFHREVLTIPHAIDASRLKVALELRSEKEHGLAAGGDITVLLPSRLDVIQKRPQIVFRGVSLLPKFLRQRIVIVATGKDPQYQSNSKKLKHIAASGGFNARFTKFRSMTEAYALADIVTLPSKSESFGYSALESLSLGIPTILNSLPTFKEIAAGNNNAHFFDQTAQAFSQTLLGVLRDPQRHPIDKAWSMRYDIRRWAEVYQNLARSMVNDE